MGEMTQHIKRLHQMITARDIKARRGGGHAKHEAIAEVCALRALLSAYEERGREVERLRTEPQTLGTKVPDYWHEAKAKWPWLPATTEALDDAWRNRTRAENALWLIEQAEAKLREVTEEFGSLLDHIVTSHEGHFGDHMAYMPHISRDEVTRGRAALAAAQPEEGK